MKRLSVASQASSAWTWDGYLQPASPNKKRTTDNRFIVVISH